MNELILNEVKTIEYLKKLSNNINPKILKSVLFSSEIFLKKSSTEKTLIALSKQFKKIKVIPIKDPTSKMNEFKKVDPIYEKGFTFSKRVLSNSLPNKLKQEYLINSFSSIITISALITKKGINNILLDIKETLKKFIGKLNELKNEDKDFLSISVCILLSILFIKIGVGLSFWIFGPFWFIVLIGVILGLIYIITRDKSSYEKE